MPRTHQDLDGLRKIAARQGGVVSSADLLSCGFSAKAVRHRIREGIWHRVGGAVVIGPMLTAPRQWNDISLAWILRVTFGPQTRISGALALKRARWQLPTEVHIVVLKDKPNISIPGVTVLRRPDARVTRNVPGVEFVTAREALADCLTVLPASLARDLLDTALQRRYVSPETLVQDLTARLGRGRLNATGLRRLIARATSGSRSEAEHRMSGLLRLSRTGLWIPNHPLVDAAGVTVAELDFANVPARIAIEVDGRAFHSDRNAFEQDRWRQNALILDGWLVLRFTWEQITQRADEVIATIRAAVAQRAA